MSNRIAHIEFAGIEGEKLESFYNGLFDWPIERQNMGGFPYGQIDFGEDSKLTGGIRHEPEGVAEIVVYVEVDDLNAALAKAQALGATVRIPPMETPAVTFALVADPEGNPVGLVQKQE